MVKVLIIEDEVDKRTALLAEVEGYFGIDQIDVRVAETFAQASSEIFAMRFDLIIADLLLPRRLTEQPTDFSEDLLSFLSESPINSKATIVAISRFATVVEKNQPQFRRAGIFLLNYSETDEWKQCLRVCMQRVDHKRAIDFVIVCALEEERGAFRDIDREDVVLGEMMQVFGLDCRELRIGGLVGLCVLQPRMGLVDATAVSAFALSSFSPRLICMSGICAGFSSEVELGSLLISDVCWEHQAGKWSDKKGFELAHYQEALNNDVRTTLSQMLEEDPTLSGYKSGLREIKVTGNKSAYILPTVSGSAVIASEKYQTQIRKQHRKVGGLDMEVFGLLRAKALYPGEVVCFAAKVVVDHADQSKADQLHEAGAILSARFVVEAIRKLLS